LESEIGHSYFCFYTRLTTSFVVIVQPFVVYLSKILPCATEIFQTAMITVPEAFAHATIARAGDAGRHWIAQLPRQVGALCQTWNLVIDGLPMHGYLGLVVPVVRGDEPCVLKLSWLDESTTDEALALAVWRGAGAVRLLDAQPALGALLLERLDAHRSLDTVEISEAIPIAGRLLRRLAIPAPPSFRWLGAVAEQLNQSLPVRWEQVGRPLPRRLLEQACALARQLGPTSEQLLVNYDLHYTDVLAGTREPWLAVDPKVVIGDPEYGLAQLLWRRLEAIQAQGGLDWHFQRLIEAAAVDPERARAWTLVRCVDYWLWGLSVGLTDDPARCAVIVDWLT
jgi:streptomycin 6-kinase